jgi:hypothetical protein
MAHKLNLKGLTQQRLEELLQTMKDTMMVDQMRPWMIY